MYKEISITKVKGIDLKFTFPESKDVFLLVGPNGVGKTTLLICIDRICNPYAFARGFYQPKNIKDYDEYGSAQIIYTVDNNSVTFKKKNAKWAATPRKNNDKLLNSFGYNGSIFIRADSKRIEPTQDEIQKGSISSADASKITTLNDIFETTKFNNLKILKVTHGRGKTPSFFNVIKDGDKYYTEKRFSTGELAIIRLIEKLNSASNGSLVLLDEAEMALHPRVQVNLLKYLKAKASEKQLTIFVSTHSPTLIKSMNPAKILLLEKKDDGIEVITPCYPARALGGIDYEESKIFDYIFFVEDEVARDILKQLVNKYISLVPDHSTALTSIIPVGGYQETARMAIRTNEQLFHHSKVFAVLDADVFENMDSQSQFAELYNNNRSLICSLYFTPEVKFIEILTSNNEDLKFAFKSLMHCEIYNIINSTEYKSCNAQNPRDLAKDRFNIFINKCVAATGDNEKIVKCNLIKFIAKYFPAGEIKRILGPMFNKRSN